MKSKSMRTTIGRAQEVNLSNQMYGTFAEIGAGQEVARFFFQAGRASQTIAKTISAYDMTFSDEIYGRESQGRYVCESRLQKMLDKEMGLLQKRLGEKKASEKRFFAYANTVATGDLGAHRKPHGWMGIRFQTQPQGPLNEIVLHLQLLDRHRLLQQESLGVLGVNLVALASFDFANPEDFVDSLIENIKSGQVSIDLIKLKGPDLEKHDQALLNLQLVKKGLSQAVLFGPGAAILNAGDELFQKTLVIQRGHFRPVTNSHVDIMKRALEMTRDEFSETSSCLPVYEISMHSLDEEHEAQDFLDRVNTLTSLGCHVLVSRFFLYYQLKSFLRGFTQEPLVIVLGANLLEKLFSASYYQDLEGGLLEGLGKLMDPHTRVLVHPSKSERSCSTLGMFHGEEDTRPIVDYFKKKKWLQELSNCDDIDVFINSNQILELIRSQDPKWKSLVPNEVVRQISHGRLFGYGA
ncbi:MAG: hypothetical protein WCH11_03745 [Bdellovibrio sp.]